MSFKTHLTIIACIIVAVLLAWQFMGAENTREPEAQPAKAAYNIAITHASWGLNCRDMVMESDTTQAAFMDQNTASSKIHEDNVLAAVSRLCNGNKSCDVTLDENSLGPDPMPSCPSKVLEIEYRCFSYDRPWHVTTSAGAASIHCQQPTN